MSLKDRTLKGFCGWKQGYTTGEQWCFIRGGGLFSENAGPLGGGGADAGAEWHTSRTLRYPRQPAHLQKPRLHRDRAPFCCRWNSITPWTRGLASTGHSRTPAVLRCVIPGSTDWLTVRTAHTIVFLHSRRSPEARIRSQMQCGGAKVHPNLNKKY